MWPRSGSAAAAYPGGKVFRQLTDPVDARGGIRCVQHAPDERRANDDAVRETADPSRLPTVTPADPDRDRQVGVPPRHRDQVLRVTADRVAVTGDSHQRRGI